MAIAFGIENAFGRQVVESGLKPVEIQERMRGFFTWASGLVISGEVAKAPVAADGTTTSLLINKDPTLFTSDSQPQLVVPSADLLDGTVLFTEQPIGEIEMAIKDAGAHAQHTAVAPQQKQLF